MHDDLEILALDNHKLYRRVQHLVSLQWKWEAIAEDVGILPTRDNVKALCNWVLAYREPKADALPLVRTSFVHDVPTKRNRVAENSSQFLAWRRETQGARDTRKAMSS